MTELSRRSMSQALQTVELTPAAAAFIREGRPMPQAQKIVGASDSANAALADGTPRDVGGSEVSASVSVNDTVPAAAGNEGSVESFRRRVSRPRLSPEAITSATSVSVTVRLPADIPTKLLRIATDRKIARQRPWTQQEIVAEALWQWLKKNGY